MRNNVIVAGFGRCGSSLVMQMLYCAPMRCWGDPPAFEPASVLPPIAPSWWADKDGWAVKVLEPHYSKIPAGENCASIWLERDPTEQALSQIKILKLLAGVDPGSSYVKAAAQSFRDEQEEAIAALPGRVLTLRFEDVLEAPLTAAQKISAHLHGEHRRFNLERMASLVLKRSPRCAPDMAIEERAIAAADRAMRAIRAAKQ